MKRYIFAIIRIPQINYIVEIWIGKYKYFSLEVINGTLYLTDISAYALIAKSRYTTFELNPFRFMMACMQLDFRCYYSCRKSVC